MQEKMTAPEHFEVMEGYCCYRLSGQGPLAEAAGKFIEAIDSSREQGMRNLLIDTTNWTGHGRPDAWERFTWAEAFAQALRRGTAIRDPRSWVWRAAYRIAAGEKQRGAK